MMNEEQYDNRIKSLEEEQKEVDEDRNYRIKNFLSKEEISQHFFCEETLQKFLDKKIPVYIFAQLPFVDDDGNKVTRVIQYNNLAAIAKNPNKFENMRFCHKFHTGMMTGIFYVFFISYSIYI